MTERSTSSFNPHDFSKSYGVSLFSGSGVGDLGFRAAGVNFLAMCEIEHDRAALAQLNFPEAEHFERDIGEAVDDICELVGNRMVQEQQQLLLITCTAPCQGMSKNGKGTLLNNIRKGKRPKLDPRNQLILPALKVIRTLRPLWVVFENVVEMQHAIIQDEDGELRPMLDIVQAALSPDYIGEAHVVEFADYGIAQRRQRLITVYTRHPLVQQLWRTKVLPLIPPRTHGKRPDHHRDSWVPVVEALREFAPLDAKCEEEASDPETPFHRVPVLEPKKYEWVRHTPGKSSAFDNQCVNPQCQSHMNPGHGASHGNDGINRAHKTTPLYCVQCGGLLPRPFVEDANGNKRIMSGYTSAYRRMDPNLPAPTLTRNLSYACSDSKIHPYQNRVLSLAEAMKIQTITDYEYKWGPITVQRGKKRVSKPTAPDTLIRLVIGESVPPRFFELMGEHVKSLTFDPKLPSAGTTTRAQSKVVPQPALW